MNLGSASNESRQQAAFYAVAVGVALLVLAGGYFVIVKPASAKAAVLKTRIARLNAEASAADSNYASAQQLSKVQLADLFDLTRAMPDDPQVAEILVVLGRLAHNSSVQFQSIKPSPVVPLAGYEAQPMEVVIEGNFYDLMEFLYELRHLVDVRQDAQGTARLYATGRLFTVNKLDIEIVTTGDLNRPKLTATVDLDAFVYATAPPAPGLPGATTGATTTTAGSASAASAPAEGTN